VREPGALASEVSASGYLDDRHEIPPAENNNETISMTRVIGGTPPSPMLTDPERSYKPGSWNKLAGSTAIMR
jgi:hypothetical protein